MQSLHDRPLGRAPGGRPRVRRRLDGQRGSPVFAQTKTGTVPAIRDREPLGLDVVFECSGDPACIEQAQQLLKPGGTLMLVGIPPTVEVQFDAHLMRTKELTFRSVRRQNGCVAPAIELLHSGGSTPRRC